MIHRGFLFYSKKPKDSGRHMDICILVDAESIVGIHIKVIPRICLPEDQIEHLQERLDILVCPALPIVKFI